MRTTSLIVITILAGLATAAGAQEPGDRPATIVVMGVGEIRTPPDIATLSFSVRGEGPASDAATQAMVDKQRNVLAGLRDLTHGAIEVRTGNVELNAARAGDCPIGRYGGGSNLSTGACAIIGYVATLQTTIRMKDIRLIGTATALAGQRGADNASITNFGLAADADARRAATAAALEDARRQAETIAAGAHEHLGKLLSVRDQQAFDASPEEITVTGNRVSAPPPPPPPPPPEVTLTPAPIATSARLTVVYAIEQ